MSGNSATSQLAKSKLRVPANVYTDEASEPYVATSIEVIANESFVLGVVIERDFAAPAFIPWERITHIASHQESK